MKKLPHEKTVHPKKAKKPRARANTQIGRALTEAPIEIGQTMPSAESVKKALKAQGAAKLKQCKLRKRLERKGSKLPPAAWD